MQRRLRQRPEGDAFQQRQQHPLERPATRIRERREHDELQDERRPENHGEAAKHRDAVGRASQRVKQQNEQKYVEQQERKPRLRCHQVEDLRGRKERRENHDEAVQVLERRARSAHQPLRREHAAAHQNAKQEHSQDKREQRRRQKRHSIGHTQAAQQGDGQKDDGQVDCFAAHFRCLKIRIGFRSDASVRRPAASSARNSSARVDVVLRIFHDEPAVGRKANRFVHALEAQLEMRVIVVQPAPT